MGQRLGEAELKRADVVIRPKVNEIGSADFNQRAAAILEGERAAMAVMPQIRAKIAQLQAARSSAVGPPPTRPKRPSNRRTSAAWNNARVGKNCVARTRPAWHRDAAAVRGDPQLMPVPRELMRN